MDTDKEEFLREFGADYGYPNGPKTIDEIRATEFKRLDGLVYLDHAGATLYSELQMEAVFKDLATSVYGNPHSQSDYSSTTCGIMKEARQQVLDYFNASPKDYKCIFTSGATAALKLVGEAFPWSHQSSFMYTMENHNSVLGIREYALGQGAAAFAIDIEETLHHVASRSTVVPVRVSQHQIQRRSEARFLEKEPTGDTYNLFAFPSECNFSGLRFNLDLVKIIKEDSERILEGSPICNGRWMVLIDAAKGCSTNPLDLSKHPADFVVVSFYKLFGYPTGLGALIARNDAAKLLKKAYFSGGTVAASIADIDFVKRREEVEELFEDGTTSFLSIASIRHGFKILNSLTISSISQHTASLTMYVRKTLLALIHDNGASVCTVYGSDSLKVSCHEWGPIVSFNLRRPDGSWFGYREVEKLASLSGIQLRTGCFCNPGACAKYLGLSHSDLLSNVEAGHVCWDDYDVVNGKPTGAVRVSFGYMSTYEDAKKFIDFVRGSFVSLPNQIGCGYHFRERSIPFPDKDKKWFAGFMAILVMLIPYMSHHSYSRVELILPKFLIGMKHLLGCTYNSKAFCVFWVPEGSGSRLLAGSFYLNSITIYPIKSCAGFSTESWPLSNTGLRYDREWILKSLTGEILTQKKVPEMCLIGTSIDLHQGILFVESPRCKERLQISLESESYNGSGEEICIRGQRYEGQGYNNEVNSWFSHALGQPCCLLRCSMSTSYYLNKSGSVGMCRDGQSRLNFSNEAQFLLISKESVSDLNNRISSNAKKGSSGVPVEVSPMRFRPNLVISGGEPYAEDGWRNLKIGDNYFTSLGGCNRCQMINLVNKAGQVKKSNEPLATLASYRRVKGQILFGLLLRYEIGDGVEQEPESLLQVGQKIHPNSF
ncbi:molybdenum cofactor sulfurase isoform X3 [Corylus avellana]|uniref:molybdenum cofactor sulfurase isoform X3 n=1 Tax=Corylus avellana TaxID=13451 RepID=UPI00286A84F7|nr:molybdenum cofactor sulfurase isoform X3 [Corylus avellana]